MSALFATICTICGVYIAGQPIIAKQGKHAGLPLQRTPPLHNMPRNAANGRPQGSPLHYVAIPSLGCGGDCRGDLHGRPCAVAPMVGCHTHVRRGRPACLPVCGDVCLKPCRTTVTGSQHNVGALPATPIYNETPHIGQTSLHKGRHAGLPLRLGM